MFKLTLGVAVAALMVSLGLVVFFPPRVIGAESCTRPLVLVSWYGKETCQGRPPGHGRGTCHTASDVPFDGSQWLVANKALPMGTLVRFTYRWRSFVAPVGDRGPYVSGRVFDLSQVVAKALGVTGVARVCAERVP